MKRFTEDPECLRGMTHGFIWDVKCEDSKCNQL